MTEFTQALPVDPLTGSERFEGLDASVLDFWRFALPDLRTNNVRGYLAEFLVARAVGSSQVRVEWGAFDTETPDGIKIEVKTTGGLQVWYQDKPSRLGFRGLKAGAYDPTTNTTASEKTYNADVYVFCHQTAQVHDQYRQLDVSQWDFYVLARDEVAATGYGSLGLTTVRRMAGDPIKYEQIAEAVKVAASRNAA